MKQMATLTIFCAVLVLQSVPMFWLLATAVQNDKGFLVLTHGEMPTTCTLAHFYELAKTTAFIRWCLNSLILAALSGTVATMSGLIMAFGSACSFRFRFVHKWLQQGVFVGYLIPSLFLIFPVRNLFASFSDLAALLSLTVLYQVFLVPIGLWLAAAYVAQIPRQTIVLSVLDALTFWNRIKLVVLPVAGRGVHVVFAITFILAFHEYIFAFMVLRDPKWQTIPVGLASLQAGDVYRWPLIAAGAILVTFGCCMLLALSGGTVARALSRFVDRVT